MVPVPLSSSIRPHTHPPRAALLPPSAPSWLPGPPPAHLAPALPAGPRRGAERGCALSPQTARLALLGASPRPSVDPLSTRSWLPVSPPLPQGGSPGLWRVEDMREGVHAGGRQISSQTSTSGSKESSACSMLSSVLYFPRRTLNECLPTTRQPSCRCPAARS